MYTGTARHADTRANVYLVIAGTEGDTGTRVLNDGERKVSTFKELLIFELPGLMISNGTLPGYFYDSK